MTCLSPNQSGWTVLGTGAFQIKSSGTTLFRLPKSKHTRFVDGLTTTIRVCNRVSTVTVRMSNDSVEWTAWEEVEANERFYLNKSFIFLELRTNQPVVIGMELEAKWNYGS